MNRRKLTSRALLVTGFAIGSAAHVLAMPKSHSAEGLAPRSTDSHRAVSQRLETSETSVEPHAHTPIQLNARPIVARIRVDLTRPRRVIVDAQQHLLVADWAAGTVVRVAPTGESEVLAANLLEPSGLAIDSTGAIFVSTHAGGMPGEGQILKLSPGGMPFICATGLTGPTDLAFDAKGILHIAEFQANRISRLLPEGEMEVVVENIAAPAALEFDSLGELYCVSSTDGAVYKFSAMGELLTLAEGLAVPYDLAFDEDGHLVVASYGSAEVQYITAKGEAKPYATVPKGTIGLSFDGDGNLVFVNWDYQTLIRVTTQLSVPCPHCGKPIPIRLRSPRPRKRLPATSTSPII